MNELESKIANLIIGSEIGREQKERIAKQISKFFLEEIKEAWISGFESGNGNQIDDLIKVNSYIKSKYNL